MFKIFVHTIVNESKPFNWVVKLSNYKKEKIIKSTKEYDNINKAINDSFKEMIGALKASCSIEYYITKECKQSLLLNSEIEKEKVDITGHNIDFYFLDKNESFELKQLSKLLD